MNIDILCNDGSPLGVVWGDMYGYNGRVGVGGAELALLTLCEAWSNAGHRVRLYNNPKGTVEKFEQLPIDSFQRHDGRDILIVFRSPNKKMFGEVTGKKIWWSTDQYTIGNFQEFSTKVDKIVTISPFHANYFYSKYGIRDTTTIDLPVRLEDYAFPTSKKKNSLIFCSVPDRGLDILAKVYRKIQAAIPDVTLTITSDYRLWGAASAMNERHISKFLGARGVRFLGAISRHDMVKEQTQSQVQAYPCTYDELFCYSVAECSVAGAYPITPPTGALATTNMGTILEGDYNSSAWQHRFIDEIVKLLSDQKSLHSKQEELATKARQRFSLESVLPQWEKVFND